MTGGNVETSVRMCDWLLCALLCQWCGKNDDSMTSKNLMIEECNEDRLEARPTACPREHPLCCAVSCGRQGKSRG